MLTVCFLWKPNAAAQPLPEAEARYERTLKAVGCSGLLGMVYVRFPISI
jgi:hypothetical protein